VTSESNFNMPWDCARTHPEYPKCDVRYISDADGNEIASLYGTLTRIPRGEDIARLIAAAPDLLEAAKAAYALGMKIYHNANAHEAPMDWGKVKALLDAAFAKAERNS